MMHQARNLSRLPGIRHGFFGRRGGVSRGPFASLNVSLRNADNTNNAWANRQTIAAHFGRRPEELIVLKQVHGTEIRQATLPFAADEPPQGDGLVADTSGLVLGVTTADCAPILLADPKNALVGAAHAGWRGALDGIAGQLVSALEMRGGTRQHMVAAIGPCIAQPSYEVGDEFQAQFLARFAQSNQFFERNEPAGKPHFDLAGFVAWRLQSAGIDDVEIVGIDTFTHAHDYFSYRRSYLAGEPHFGLQLSTIALVDV